MKRIILFSITCLLAVSFVGFSKNVEAKSFAREFRDGWKGYMPRWQIDKQNIANCYLGFSLHPGTRVFRVDQRSFAAGLRQNDVILHADGISISSNEEFREVYGKKSNGETLTLELVRHGNMQNIDVECKDGTKYVNAIQTVFDAILKKDWDSCLERIGRVQEIAGTNNRMIADLRNNCSVAKGGGRGKDYSDAQLAYTATKFAIQEANGSEVFLSEIQGNVIYIVDWLRSNNFSQLASQLDSDFRQAENETAQLKSTKSAPPSNSPNGGSSGTCFFVDGFGTAVTNNHVIEGHTNIEVIAANGSKSSATIIKSSKVLDVAILATGHQTPQFLTLAATGTLALGQDVFTIGFPVTNILGDKPKYSEGTISALSGLNNDDSWIQMSTPIQPGNSGGPLVDLNGQVVGIVTATAAVENFFALTGSLPQNINWAIKAEYARALIPDSSSNTHISNKQEAIAHTEKSVCRVIAQ
jgi:S1-C subfamily serine protease